MRKKQTGFTLVEIAIVLVIVGLLLGGVLKGQELIFNSKVKGTYNLTREFSAAVNGYQDRYKQWPGDDPGALARFPVYTPAVVNGNGNGVVETGAWCAPGSTGTENCRALSHLRAAGFITGVGENGVITPLGGVASIHSANGGVNGASSAQLVMTNSPGAFTHKGASALDVGYDDGNPSTGTMRCQGLAGAYNLATPDASTPGWCHIFL